MHTLTIRILPEARCRQPSSISTDVKGLTGTRHRMSGANEGARMIGVIHRTLPAIGSSSARAIVHRGLRYRRRPFFCRSPFLILRPPFLGTRATAAFPPAPSALHLRSGQAFFRSEPALSLSNGAGFSNESNWPDRMAPLS